MPRTEADVRRDGDALVFGGAIDRSAAASLWPASNRLLEGTQRFVLTEVTSVDSAGLALLAELAARLRLVGTTPEIVGEPAGLRELSTAYRLTAGMDFPGTSPTS